jgi:hypothetical protein
MRGDITPFYDNLHHRWKQGPAAIAGLTPAHALLGLEMMADASQMRIALRVEQHMDPSGGAEWRIDGPTHVVDAADLLRSGQEWGVHAARLAAACAPRWTRTTTARIPCLPASPAARAERLTLWVLAPIVRT